MMQLKLIPRWANPCCHRQFCAAILSAAYVTLYGVAALCLGTGVFHPEIADQTAPHDHHETTPAHPRHHRGPADDDADTTPATVPDICDFVIQALTTPTSQINYQPVHALAQIGIVGMDDDRVIPVLLRLAHCSRAPPCDADDVA